MIDLRDGGKPNGREQKVMVQTGGALMEAELEVWIVPSFLTDYTRGPQGITSQKREQWS